MHHATERVIDYFSRINRIPRCSKNEARISQWLQEWADRKGLTTKSDASGNLVIRVPATDGFEDAPVVVLQGHMDMVCEKTDDSDHNFLTDPIRMLVDGPWLRAHDTTLGADNGIALALALALVEDPDVSHPPLELFFTVDEETGLTGVLQMDPDLLSGKLLVNLDSEDEGVFVVGCAGGRSTTIHRPLDAEPLNHDYDLLHVTAQGLRGGHSGVDIAKHRANANQIMARLLNAVMTEASLRLVELSGGTGKNVIPRTCETVVACRRDRMDGLEKAILSVAEVIKGEYRLTDAGLHVHVNRQGPAQASQRGVTPTDTAVVVDLLMALPHGPLEMAADFPLLVQTSANLSLVKMETSALAITTSQRSSVPSRLDAICLAVEAAGRLAGATVHTSAGYPSWPMNPDSALLKRCTTLYNELFATPPIVQIMHAGLECGVIGDRCPGMDMISLGPTLENPHSPSERLFLPSVEKVWRLMVALLKSFKKA